MITDALIDIFVYVLAPIINTLIPSLDVSGWATFSSNTAGALGNWLGSIANYFPVVLLLQFLQLFLELLPVVGAYIVFQWLWDHIPSIAGFGTG